MGEGFSSGCLSERQSREGEGRGKREWGQEGSEKGYSRKGDKDREALHCANIPKPARGNLAFGIMF